MRDTAIASTCIKKIGERTPHKRNHSSYTLRKGVPKIRPFRVDGRDPAVDLRKKQPTGSV